MKIIISSSVLDIWTYYEMSMTYLLHVESAKKQPFSIWLQLGSMKKNQNYDHQYFFWNYLKFFCRTPDVTDTIDKERYKRKFTFSSERFWWMPSRDI